mgnify:CR=1 FL=1
MPSRNSSDAPPPVEMWLILSAKPSWFTAAAESPPPMMVVASVSARAFATAIVPFARTGFYEYTIGPIPNNSLAVLAASANSSADFGPISRPILSAGIFSTST